jgi:hypothetical protein
VVNQTFRPFLPKIALAEQRHKELLQAFLKKRHQAKESFKESAGLAALERELKQARAAANTARTRSPEHTRSPKEQPRAHSQSVVARPGGPAAPSPRDGPRFQGAVKVLADVKTKHQRALYSLCLDIETRFLGKERKDLDLAEALLIYTKNQFLRELKRTMNEDEGRTLKYQMIKMAQTFEDLLGRLVVDWGDYGETRLQGILDEHYKQQFEWEEQAEKVLAKAAAKKAKKAKEKEE